MHSRITELPVPWRCRYILHPFLSCFYRKQMKTVDHKHLDTRQIETRRLEILETSLWCQPIWEMCMSWPHTCSPPPAAPHHSVFKKISPKAFRGVESFEHEPLFLLAQHQLINAALSFTTVWCQQIDFTAQRQADPSPDPVILLTQPKS